jgi:hypothetical protein
LPKFITRERLKALMPLDMRVAVYNYRNHGGWFCNSAISAAFACSREPQHQPLQLVVDGLAPFGGSV